LSGDDQEAQAGEYTVNALLVDDHNGLTGICVPAQHPEDGLGVYDVACLMADDFDLWLTAKENRPEETAKALLQKLIEAQTKIKAAEAAVEKLTEKVSVLVAEVEEITGG